jgi:hypothetical protein
VHSWPPVHTTPQAPQFRGSCPTFVQAPPQSNCGVGQPVLVHVPATHASPAPQAFPQAPQFWKLCVVSTH